MRATRSFLLLPLLVLAAAPAAAGEVKPYVRATLGLGWSGDTRFTDATCHGGSRYLLFGCVDGEDGRPIAARGDFGTSALLGLGAGLELTPWFRLEANLETQPNLAFRGQANFNGGGNDQPAKVDLTQADLMAFAYLEPLAAMGIDTPLRPFIGLGAGASLNSIGQMRYDFPELPQPRYTLMPDGTHVDFAWSAAAGLAYPVSDWVTLELAYRYSDLGKVETDEGTVFIQKHASTLSLPIAGTEADLVSQSVTMSARFGF